MFAAKLFVFLGFVAVMVFLVFILWTQGSLETKLECDRGEGICTFTTRHISGTSKAWEHLSGMGPAEVRVSSSSTGRRARPVIAVWVKSREGDSYFDDYPTRAAAGADAEQINRFLNTPSLARFSLIRGHAALYWTAWVLSIGVSLMVGGLGYLLFRRGGRTASTRRP
jgi:hypothetical protein